MKPQVLAILVDALAQDVENLFVPLTHQFDLLAEEANELDGQQV